MKKILLLITILILATAIAACGQGDNGEGAALVVEAYLTALVDEDQDALVNFSCAAWEASAKVESQAYYGVETRMEELACTISEVDGDFTVVSCEGNIIASYSGEDLPMPLNARDYLATEEGGEWRMCGYR